MEVAEKHFKIPMVLEPEYLSNPNLDELSGMTYLSYFMKEEASPGYYATLNWVKNQIPNMRINNFRVNWKTLFFFWNFFHKAFKLKLKSWVIYSVWGQNPQSIYQASDTIETEKGLSPFLQTDWNDGLAASSLVKAKGGPVPNFREMDNYPENWTSNLEMAINGGNKIGVPEVLQPKDMANPNVEYLGVMAWVAQFQWIPDKTPPSERMEMRCNVSKVKVGEEVSFQPKVTLLVCRSKI